MLTVGGGKEVVPGGSRSDGLRAEEDEDHVGPVLGCSPGQPLNSVTQGTLV